jgi:hypothetical protein
VLDGNRNPHVVGGCGEYGTGRRGPRVVRSGEDDIRGQRKKLDFKPESRRQCGSLQMANRTVRRSK